MFVYVCFSFLDPDAYIFVCMSFLISWFRCMPGLYMLSSLSHPVGLSSAVAGGVGFLLCSVTVSFRSKQRMCWCRLRSRGLTYSSCTLQNKGLTYSSRKSRGQPWLQNVSLITTCPFIITIQGGTLVNLQICEQKNMKTLVPKFGHKDSIQHSASPYYNSKRRPAHGNLYRVLCVFFS